MSLNTQKTDRHDEIFLFKFLPRGGEFSRHLIGCGVGRGAVGVAGAVVEAVQRDKDVPKDGEEVAAQVGAVERGGGV